MTNSCEIGLTFNRSPEGLVSVKIPGVYGLNGSPYYALMLTTFVSLIEAIEETRNWHKIGLIEIELKREPTITDNELAGIKRKTVQYLDEVLEVLKVRSYIEENQG